MLMVILHKPGISYLVLRNLPWVFVEYDITASHEVQPKVE
jgi:hypothetical protein